jgi:hypothetical protein
MTLVRSLHPGYITRAADGELIYLIKPYHQNNAKRYHDSSHDFNG